MLFDTNIIDFKNFQLWVIYYVRSSFSVKTHVKSVYQCQMVDWKYIFICIWHFEKCLVFYVANLNSVKEIMSITMRLLKFMVFKSGFHLDLHFCYQQPFFVLLWPIHYTLTAISVFKCAYQISHWNQWSTTGHCGSPTGTPPHRSEHRYRTDQIVRKQAHDWLVSLNKCAHRFWFSAFLYVSIRNFWKLKFNLLLKFFEKSNS